MRDAVIVSAVRTPVGRGVKGTLANTRPDDLAALVLNEAVKRAAQPLERDPKTIASCPFGRVIRGDQWSSGGISGHQSSSEVIIGHQRPSEVIRGHQRSSEIIRDHQGSSPAHLGMRRWSHAVISKAARLPALALCSPSPASVQ